MTIDVKYKRYFLSTFTYDFIVDNCYILKLQLFNLRKRQRTKMRTFQLNKTS